MLRAILLTFAILITVSFTYGARIKSIQRDTTHIPISQNYVIVKLDHPVILSKSILQFSYTCNSSDPDELLAGGELQDSVTIVFYRHKDTSTAFNQISWEVLEFEDGVYVQHGKTINAGEDSTVTISPVSITNSFVFSNKTNSGTGYGERDAVTSELLDSNSLRLYGGANNNFSNVYWQVVEYDSCNVRILKPSLSSTTDSLSVYIPSKFDSKKSIVFGNHTYNNNAKIIGENIPIVHITSDSTINIYSMDTAVYNINFVLYLVEFTDETNVSHYLTKFTNELSIIDKIKTVSRTCSGIINPSNFGRQGSTKFNSNSNMGYSLFSAYLSNHNTVYIQRAENLGSNAAAKLAYQIVSFGGCNVFVDAGTDTSICLGDTIHLDSTRFTLDGIPPFKYEWVSHDEFLNNDTILTPHIFPTNTSQYVLKVTDSIGLVGYDSIQVNVSNVQINGLEDQISFINDSVNIADSVSISSGFPPYSFTWAPHSNLNNNLISNPIFYSDTVGIYNIGISVSDNINCISETDSIKITIIYPLVISGRIDTTICKYDTAYLQSNTLSGNPPYRFKWIFGNTYLNNDTISSPIAFPDSTQMFIVEVTDSYSLNDYDTIIVNIAPLPNINFTTIDTILINDQNNSLTDLGNTPTASGINPPFEYAWGPDSFLNSDTSSNPIFSAPKTGSYRYSLKVTDQLGCTAFDSITIYVDTILDTFFLSIPNTFSPNGDDLNDQFSPIVSNRIESFLFQIFDRKGNILFETSDPNFKWDGTYNNKPSETGNYMYYMFVVPLEGEPEERRGIITLLR